MTALEFLEVRDSWVLCSTGAMFHESAESIRD